MKRFFTSAMLMLICIIASASNYAKTDTTSIKKKTEKSLDISMPVKDHISHDGIDSTLTAILLNANDSSFVDSLHTDIEKWGGKRFTYVSGDVKKPGSYLICLNASNYKSKYIELNIPKFYKHERHMELKPAYMHQMPKKWEQNLDELVVTATKLKFFMNGDTLVYNADAFNLAQGSMIQTLIQKLPGVEIKSGGEIYVNGQKVQSLLLNGKDFFDSDRELMLENMPAYMVKNIQSYERVPDNVKGTNKEKNTPKELVMNVKLKREYNAGWLFNAEGGIGTTFYKNEQDKLGTKFMGRLFGLHFSDKSRLMMYANANNLNDDHTPGQNGEWATLSQSEGETETYKGGIDYNVGSWEHQRYHGSASATYTELNNSSYGSSETFLEGGNTYGKSFSNERSYNFKVRTSHDYMFRTREAKNWYKNIMFFTRPYISYSRSNSNSNSADVTFNEDVASGLGKAWMDSIARPNAGAMLQKYAINRTINSTKGKGHNTSLGNHLWFSYTPAHNDMLDFSLSSNFEFADKSNDNFNHYRLDYPRENTLDFRNKYTPTTSRTSSFSINPEVDFALNSNEKCQHHVNVSYTYSYGYSNSNNSLYLLNKLKEWGDGTSHAIGTLPSMDEMLSTLDADNSSRSKSITNHHKPNLTYSITAHEKNVFSSLDFGIALPMKHEKLDYWQGSQVDTIFSRNTKFLQPSVSYRYDNWEVGKRIDASYEMTTEAPEMTSLLNITSTSDPLNITRSNQHLKNTRTHSFSASYNDKYGRGTLFNISADATITENAIASGFIYDKSTGVRTITPDNVNGNWSFNADAGIDFPFDKGEKWRFNDNISYNYDHSVDLSGTSNELQATRSVVGSNYLNEEISLNYRPSDKMEFSINGDIHYQHSTSEREDFTAMNVYDFDYGFTAQIELPLGIQLSTDVTMYSRRGYSDDSMNTNELVWNARLTKKLMHGNLLIYFDGFDILGKLSNVKKTINAQGKTETYYNVIPSYGLLHIAWKFNKNPKKKA